MLLNHSSDIDKNCAAEPYSFLVNDTTLPSDDPLRFRISALSSGKIDRYEYLTGEEILPSNQQHVIEQAKFTYSPLGKAFEKQTKTIEDQGEKQIKEIQDNKNH